MSNVTAAPALKQGGVAASGNERNGASMAGTTNKRLPTASDAALRVAEAEAEKAEERRRAAAAAEAEKKALLDSFQNPPAFPWKRRSSAQRRLSTEQSRMARHKCKFFAFPMNFAPTGAAQSIKESRVGRTLLPEFQRICTSSGTNICARSAIRLIFR